MAQGKRGCGCTLVGLVLLLAVLGGVGYKFVLPWWKTKPPPPSGGELQVHVLDVGPNDGDAILIISPAGKTVLVDAGDGGKNSKAAIADAFKRYNVGQLDYFIATHAHQDHIGGAADVLKSVKTLTVLHNDFPPPEMKAEEQSNQPAPASGKKQAAQKKQPAPASKQAGRLPEFPTVKTYREFKDAVGQSGAEFKKAEPGQKYDLGGGAFLTVLAPIPPLFTEEQVRSNGGNLPNANSIVLRLDYGDFSMLLPGDAEALTEERMMSKGTNLAAKILKVAHHGSKYATTEDFIKRVGPQVAIISDGEYNRYGHPSQVVLDHLKAAGVKIYRTDLQGEISITTNGREKNGKLFDIKTAKDAKSDLSAGREAQKDDSERSGFISYGDFGPPPKPKTATHK